MPLASDSTLLPSEKPSISAATARWLGQAPEQAALVTPAEADVMEERLLRFALQEGETALLPLSSVQEVLQVPKRGLLRVPEMHRSILGVANCRGSILWMVDLSALLGRGVEQASLSQQSWVPTLNRSQQSLSTIAVQVNGVTLGLIVHRVMDIETYGAEQLQPPSTDLFSVELMPFLSGYLSQGCSPILNASALIDHLQLQR